MASHRRGLPAPLTRLAASLLASALASCVTTNGPQEVRISAIDTPWATHEPGLKGTVDFQRLLFEADIRAEHYVGDLRADPQSGSFKVEPRTANGARLNCFLVQVQPARWYGECVDAQDRVFELSVGRTFHI
jgi:hypothetical protein